MPRRVVRTTIKKSIELLLNFIAVKSIILVTNVTKNLVAEKFNNGQKISFIAKRFYVERVGMNFPLSNTSIVMPYALAAVVCSIQDVPSTNIFIFKCKDVDFNPLHITEPRY